MFAEQIISNAIPPITTNDTVQYALDRMTEFKLKHFPVVDDGQFYGLVVEDDLLSIRNTDNKISELSVTLLNAFVFNNAHSYNVMHLFSQLNLTSVAVLDQHKHYLGIISINNIMGYMVNQFAVNEPGGIIVLEINNRDNSLAHIAQVVEADNAQILSSYVNTFPNSTRLEITLKINKTEISALLASFERYEYTIVAVFNNTQNDDGSQERFDSFMNYLNV